MLAMRKLLTAIAAFSTLSAAACKDFLNVPNQNNPDIQRAYSTPTVLEQLVSTLPQRVYADLHNCTTCLSPSLLVMAFQYYSTNANFGMSTRQGLPRNAISNARNNSTFGENFRDFSVMSKDARLAADIVTALDSLLARGGTLGDPRLNNTGLNLRARSIALFSNAFALGNLALMYDSAAIVTHQSLPATVETPPLSGYADVMKAALAQLDSAIAVALESGASAGFPLPDTYINGNPLSQADYIRFLRSYKARFRASVARTPEERAAVNWDAVIDDAKNGIKADFVIQLNPSLGWDIGLEGSQSLGMPMWYYGMADTSGSYATWLGQSLDTKVPFVVKTGDQRWPWGETDLDQQKHRQSTWVYNALPYILETNATTGGIGWGYSLYSFRRFGAIDVGAGTGPWIDIPKTEIDMLAAEGYIRKGDFASAAALIDVSRVRAGLPPLSGVVNSASTPVPGATYVATLRISDNPTNPAKKDTVQTGWEVKTVIPGAKNCVPQVPVAPTFKTTACGNIMEAMKYEKRLETALTGYGSWYIDARGWGDLPEGTATQWPVPYQEMDSRQKPFYNLGGIGGNSGAAKGTYGF
jgi:hypothetical protein